MSENILLIENAINVSDKGKIVLESESAKNLSGSVKDIFKLEYVEQVDKAFREKIGLGKDFVSWNDGIYADKRFDKAKEELAEVIIDAIVSKGGNEALQNLLGYGSIAMLQDTLPSSMRGLEKIIRNRIFHHEAWGELDNFDKKIVCKDGVLDVDVKEIKKFLENIDSNKNIPSEVKMMLQAMWTPMILEKENESKVDSDLIENAEFKKMVKKHESKLIKIMNFRGTTAKDIEKAFNNYREEISEMYLSGILTADYDLAFAESRAEDLKNKIEELSEMNDTTERNNGRHGNRRGETINLDTEGQIGSDEAKIAAQYEYWNDDTVFSEERRQFLRVKYRRLMENTPAAVDDATWLKYYNDFRLAENDSLPYTRGSLASTIVPEFYHQVPPEGMGFDSITLKEWKRVLELRMDIISSNIGKNKTGNAARYDEYLQEAYLPIYGKDFDLLNKCVLGFRECMHINMSFFFKRSDNEPDAVSRIEIENGKRKVNKPYLIQYTEEGFKETGLSRTALRENFLKRFKKEIAKGSTQRLRELQKLDENSIKDIVNITFNLMYSSNVFSSATEYPMYTKDRPDVAHGRDKRKHLSPGFLKAIYEYGPSQVMHPPYRAWKKWRPLDLVEVGPGQYNLPNVEYVEKGGKVYINYGGDMEPWGGPLGAWMVSLFKMDVSKNKKVDYYDEIKTLNEFGSGRFLQRCGVSLLEFAETWRVKDLEEYEEKMQEYKAGKIKEKPEFPMGISYAQAYIEGDEVFTPPEKDIAWGGKYFKSDLGYFITLWNVMMGKFGKDDKTTEKVQEALYDVMQIRLPGDTYPFAELDRNPKFLATLVIQYYGLQDEYSLITLKGAPPYPNNDYRKYVKSLLLTEWRTIIPNDMIEAVAWELNAVYNNRLMGDGSTDKHKLIGHTRYSEEKAVKRKINN